MLVSMTPRLVADTNDDGPVATPTWEAPGPLESKNTRAPAWMALRSTGDPTPN